MKNFLKWSINHEESTETNSFLPSNSTRKEPPLLFLTDPVKKIASYCFTLWDPSGTTFPTRLSVETAEYTKCTQHRFLLVNCFDRTLNWPISDSVNSHHRALAFRSSTGPVETTACVQRLFYRWLGMRSCPHIAGLTHWLTHLWLTLV